MKRKLQYEVTEEDNMMRLDQYIAKKCMDLSRSYIQKLIKDNLVTVNDVIRNKNKTPIQTGNLIVVS